MKNLKLLGVLLVSFMVLGLNVFAENDAYVKIIRGGEEIEYTDLESAFDAFTKTEAGDEISVLKNLDLTTICDATNSSDTTGFKLYISFADNVKLNLNGNTITSSPVCIRYSGKNLTVKNGAFNVNNGSYGLYIGHQYSEGPSENVILEDLTIDGGLNVYYAKNVILRNVKSTGTNFYSVWGDYYADIVIESGEFTSAGPGVISLSAGHKSNGVITEGTPASVAIKGGTFTAKEKTTLVYSGSDLGKPVISGGTFNTDPKDYLADGYAIGENEGIYVVMKETTSDLKEIDTKTEVKEVTVGIADAKATEEVLLKSLEANKDLAEKVEGTPVKVEVEIALVKPETIKENVKTSMAETAGNAKIATYFDITVAIKNAVTKAHIDNIPELNSEIELVVLLPEDLRNTDTNVNRAYYIIREHEGKVEKLPATLSRDGNSLTFKSKYFSTFALAYEDVAKVTEKVEEKVPQTADGITTTLIIGTLAIISAIGISLYFKKEMN